MAKSKTHHHTGHETSEEKINDTVNTSGGSKAIQGITALFNRAASIKKPET
jgi:hypothetical protein